MRPRSARSSVCSATARDVYKRQGHLHHRLGKAVFDRPRTHDLARARKRGETLPHGGLLLGRFACEEVDAVVHRLQVGRQQLAFAQRRDGEGDERRRHIAVKRCV